VRPGKNKNQRVLHSKQEKKNKNKNKNRSKKIRASYSTVSVVDKELTPHGKYCIEGIGP